MKAFSAVFAVLLAAAFVLISTQVNAGEGPLYRPPFFYASIFEDSAAHTGVIQAVAGEELNVAFNHEYRDSGEIMLYARTLDGQSKALLPERVSVNFYGKILVRFTVPAFKAGTRFMVYAELPNGAGEYAEVVDASPVTTQNWVTTGQTQFVKVVDKKKPSTNQADALAYAQFVCDAAAKAKKKVYNDQIIWGAQNQANAAVRFCASLYRFYRDETLPYELKGECHSTSSDTVFFDAEAEDVLVRLLVEEAEGKLSKSVKAFINDQLFGEYGSGFYGAKKFLKDLKQHSEVNWFAAAQAQVALAPGHVWESRTFSITNADGTREDYVRFQVKVVKPDSNFLVVKVTKMPSGKVVPVSPEQRNGEEPTASLGEKVPLGGTKSFVLPSELYGVQVKFVKNLGDLKIAEIRLVAMPATKTATKTFSKSEAQDYYNTLLARYGKVGQDKDYSEYLGKCRDKIDESSLWSWKEFPAYKRNDLTTVSVAAFSDSQNADKFLECMKTEFDKMGEPENIASKWGVPAYFYKYTDGMGNNIELVVFTYANVYVYLLAREKTGVRNVFDDVTAMLAK